LSLEGLLALIAIIIAIYALAQPVQRRSVLLLVPIWLVVLSVVISAGLLIWRYAVPTFHYEFYPWADFVSMVGAFFLPTLGIIIAYVFWLRAKLSAKKDRKFRKFILTCIKDNRFDELLRILDKNEKSLVNVLERDTLDLLFDRRFVEHTISARNWIHLRLLSNKELIEKLTDRFAATNSLMRKLVAAETSPLHSAIVAVYGGREHTYLTDDERKLIDETLQNPEWYMSVRADYTLIIYAYESI